MRHHPLLTAALALTLAGCAVPGRPGLPGEPSPGPDGVIVNNGGNIVGNAGGKIISPNGAALTAEEAAYVAVLAATTEAVMTGPPAEGAKAEAPFTTLAVGDRLKERVGTPEEIQAKIQGQVRGTFQVDLTKLGTTTAVTKTAAEPATATLVKYLGTGTEPLHGLSTETRGVTIDRAAKTIRSNIDEKQGLVLLGGKNLFGKTEYAALPFMKGAIASGFGAEGTVGTQVSWQVGASAAGDGSGVVTLPYKVAITSETVPQVSGELTLKLAVDQAAQALTMTLTGPYTVKAPGGEVVLKSGTVEQSKTTTLTEAKASFVAAVESLQGLK